MNNAGVGLQAPASTGTYKDWEWGLGVNLWGPIYGVNTYVPRMLASKQGAHIVTTTSTSGILPGSGAGIYTVSKIAAVGLMEELRHELRDDQHRHVRLSSPASRAPTSARARAIVRRHLKNDGPPAVRPARSRGRPGRRAAPAASAAADAEQPDPAHRRIRWSSARLVLDGILHNDLFIVLQPEYRQGVEARCNALLDSMVPFKPMPPSR